MIAESENPTKAVSAAEEGGEAESDPVYPPETDNEDATGDGGAAGMSPEIAGNEGLSKSPTMRKSPIARRSAKRPRDKDRSSKDTLASHALFPNASPIVFHVFFSVLYCDGNDWGFYRYLRQ